MLVVNAAMLFLAIQITIVLKADKMVQASDDIYDTEETQGVESVHNFEEEDKKILLKIAMAEAEGEGVEGKAYVMMVILNRMSSVDFPETIKGIVFEKNQFTPVKKGGRYWTIEPDKECYEAYQLLQSGWDESEGALYFCRTGSSSWMEKNTEYLYTIGNHSFYK
jgi:N-acetylmuramoyl-L-alanine amidase